jgi:hypothetical protein
MTMQPSNPKLSALYAILARTLKHIPSGTGSAVTHFHSVWGPAGEVVEAADALHKLHVARNPKDTSEEVHFKRIAAAAAKVLQKVDLADSAVKVGRDKGLADIQNRIRATLQLKPNAHASEVRAVFRQMPQEQRLKTLSQLMESTENGAELAALFLVSPMLSGLPEVMRNQLQSAYTAKHAAQELAEEQMILNTFNDAQVVLETAKEFAAEYTDQKKLADITKREAEAAAAQANFDAKVKAA